MGRIGLSNPLTHLIDHYALTDPLLARLPVLYTPDWRIGHLDRLIPHGYRESVQQATNLIVDPVVKALYADLRVITRTPQLWSRARWAAMWRVNTGVHRRRIDRWFANPGGVLPVIKVEWAATLDPVRRTMLERTLGLYHATHDVGNTWQYELPNASPGRLRTIVTHPLVVATHGFDRDKLVLDSP